MWKNLSFDILKIKFCFEKVFSFKDTFPFWNAYKHTATILYYEVYNSI